MNETREWSNCMGKSVTKIKMHRMTQLMKTGKLVYEILDCEGNKYVFTPCKLEKCRKNEMKKSE